MKKRERTKRTIAAILFGVFLLMSVQLPTAALAEGAPAAEAAPAAEEELPVEEAAPAEEEIPVEEAAPAEEEIPAEEAAPADEEIPAEVEDPAGEEVPAEEAPAEEAAPAEEETPAAEEEPAEEAAPAEEEIPAEVETAAVSEDTLQEPAESAPGAAAGAEEDLSDDPVFSSDSRETGSRIVYVYNATLFNEESGDYPGVYSTALIPNTDSAESAKTNQTIGVESIADQNLPDVPTTESPAIIQGAAVGYENRLGPTEFEQIDPNRPKPAPYSEFQVKILEEAGQDGTVHKKPSGFDGTYVIIRLDVSEFFSSGSDNIGELYLHMEQKDNKALMPAATAAKAETVKPEDYTPTNSFTDGLGNRSASYKLEDLVDSEGGKPFLDIILYATAANVAGADAGKENVANGDVPLALYIDNTLQYNDDLKEYDPANTENVDPNADQNDPNAKTSTAYDNKWHAKFFDPAKAGTSRYLVKGSDLALETAVENSGGEGKDTGTTYWSLHKSMEHSYYDQEIDKDPEDAGSGRTVKLMSEVAITNGLTLQGESSTSLKKRMLDVNSYDVQIATNTGTEGSAAEDITLTNAWMTIADNSNTTGAEMAIGNNARFVIDQGGKLIIDETCQLEIEWDGATTTPGQAQPEQPDVLNNGQLDLRPGGEIVNNGILTIEGTEGKPYQEGSGQEQQVIDSEKGRGEMTIREGATLTNNGSLVVYGTLTNHGTLVNNGKFSDVIPSNDPDKGAFNYHKGIQVAWKDDVTQKNIEPGSLINEAGGTLINNGDIVLTPGTLDNKGLLRNEAGANIYSAAATEAIIPITPDPATPTVVSKRITLDPVQLSNIVNSGTLINAGSIGPATVKLNDNIGFGELTAPGDHPELFVFTNNGTLINVNDVISGGSGEVAPSGNASGAALISALTGSIQTANDIWLYLYDDGTFLMVLPDGVKLTGTYGFTDDQLVFTFEDGTVAAPAVQDDESSAYTVSTGSGLTFEFVLSADFVEQIRKARKV